MCGPATSSSSRRSWKPAPTNCSAASTKSSARSRSLSRWTIPLSSTGSTSGPTTTATTLTAALVESGVAHRWEGTTIFVAAEAEPAVDELLDGIEAGTVVAGDAAAPPEDALPRLFAAADRLAKDPEDRVGREDVAVLSASCDPGHPPYGLAKNVWRGVVEASGRLAEATDAAEPVPSDVIGAAQHLRSLVRPYV